MQFLFGSYTDSIMPMIYWSIFFNLLTFVIWPRLNAKITSIARWKNAQPQEIKHLASLDWDVRCSSILNSIMVFGLTSAALVNDIDIADVNSQSALSKMAMQMCGGYFITDFIVVIICRNYYPGVSDFVIHHIVAISAFVLVHHYSACHWFLDVRLLSELSTPFVNLRWMLLQVNLKDTAYYSINRHLTFWAFFVARIVSIPIFWGAAIYHFGTPEWNELHWSIKTIVFTNGLPLDILNINWFIKLARGMRRKTTDADDSHASGMAKSEDPTEGSIFGRVNVKTIMLIEKIRRTSYEKLNSFNEERRKMVTATYGRLRKHMSHKRN